MTTSSEIKIYENMLIDECYKEAEILQNEANYTFDEVTQYLYSF